MYRRQHIILYSIFAVTSRENFVFTDIFHESAFSMPPQLLPIAGIFHIRPFVTLYQHPPTPTEWPCLYNNSNHIYLAFRLGAMPESCHPHILSVSTAKFELGSCFILSDRHKLSKMIPYQLPSASEYGIIYCSEHNSRLC